MSEASRSATSVRDRIVACVVAAAFVLRRRMPAPGLPVAATAHAVLLAWLASLAIQGFERGSIVEQGVEVELQTLDEFDALVRPKPAAALPELPPEPEEPASTAGPLIAPHRPAPVEADGMVHPPRMLSQRVLSDPRSRETVALLPRLAADERVEQLCGLEAMSQIHDWQRDLEPDRVTAYALANTTFSGRVLTAEGAAFRSKQRWYGLRFVCTVSADLKGVTAFAFNVGAMIPRSRWGALGLPAVH